MIPKKIFSFWSGKTSIVVDACFRRFEELHPGWIIEIHNDFSQIEPCEGFEKLGLHHKTDWLRICLISKYGGVWLDASMVLNKPVTEWLDLSDHRVVGFQCPIGIGESSPVLENWTFAAKANHPLINNWKAECRKTINMGYKAFKEHTLKTMPHHPVYDQLPYLTMHAAYIKVHDPLQVHMIHCFDPQHGPFAFTQEEWKSGHRWYAVYKLFRRPFENMSSVKLTGETRFYAERYLKLFPVSKHSYMHRTLKYENLMCVIMNVIIIIITVLFAYAFIRSMFSAKKRQISSRVL
tara:strand:- start:2708 stop:3586 length:879 start_codon:yes stop_codon:yes gene_type:complete